MIDDSGLEGAWDWTDRVVWKPLRVLFVVCWCQDSTKQVPAVEVRAELTRACRKKECREIDEDMRWKSGWPGDLSVDGLWYEKIRYQQEEDDGG